MTNKPHMLVSERHVSFGHPEPQIILTLPVGTPRREVSAVLHELVATIERATPRAEGWIVRIQQHEREPAGRVYLVLEGPYTFSEARRAKEILMAVAASAGAEDQPA